MSYVRWVATFVLFAASYAFPRWVITIPRWVMGDTFEGQVLDACWSQGWHDVRARLQGGEAFFEGVRLKGQSNEA